MECKPEEKPKNNADKKPKPPLMVRQTLTSYKRMLKANPLLKYQEAGVDIDEILAQKSLSSSSRTASLTAELNAKPSTSEFKRPESKPLMRTQSLKLPKSSLNSLGAKRPTVVISANRSLINNNLKKKTVVSTNNASQDVVSNKRPPINEIKAKVNSFPKRLVTKPTDEAAEKPKPQVKPESKKQNSPLRKSLSSGHLQMKKGQYFDPKRSYVQLNHSKSEDHLCIPVASGFKEISPIMEENGERNFVFKTPSAYDRRSICHYTPQSNRRTTLFKASTPAPVEMKRLQERLNKWLKSRGKPPASFHNLRVFGNEFKKSPALSDIDDENKENIEVISDKSDSYENLMITASKEDNVEKVENKQETSEEDLSKYAKEAMTELLKLIGEDYPRDQCLGWLELIREKCSKIDNEPEYWECRAAIEQSVGNVHNAVEFYKTAIIQGAEVNAVDKSLDQLLKKFSLLNISPSKSVQKTQENSDQERIVREARNVFKSSIIQFAIRERNMKKTKDETLVSVEAPPPKKLVATPVRRSTRLSRSSYTSTAGVKLCKSLREFDMSEGEICFETNKALC